MSDGDRISDLERQLREVKAVNARLAERIEVLLAERKSDEARRRQFGAIVEASRDAIWSWDMHGIINYWNAEATRLLQYTPEEIIGRSILTLVPPDRWQGARDALGQLADGQWIGQFETVRLRKDGTPVEVEITVSPIHDSRGRVTGAATVCRDITERRRTEARQQLLLRELDHRVQNTLATVLALMQQTQRTSTSMEEFVRAFEGRLETLLRAHNALLKNSLGGASLHDLLEAEIRAFTPDGHDAVALDGEPIMLNARSAQLICLAVRELAANAARHGALSVPPGRVSLAWRIDMAKDEPYLRLDWREEQGPPLDGTPARRGFGRTLLERGVATALGGAARLEFATPGVRYELVFPARENIVGWGGEDSGGARPRV